MMWHVYILETKKGSLYTGMTNDVPSRMHAHKQGKGAKFTRSFGFKKLLYTEEHPTKSSALKREKEIQQWPRQKKLDLIKKSVTL